MHPVDLRIGGPGVRTQHGETRRRNGESHKPLRERYLATGTADRIMDLGYAVRSRVNDKPFRIRRIDHPGRLPVLRIRPNSPAATSPAANSLRINFTFKTLIGASLS